MVRQWPIFFVVALATACGSGSCEPTSTSGGPPSDTKLLDSSGDNGPGLRQRPAALALPVPRTFDLSHVTAEGFAEALGKDPSRIFDFVRDYVAFEPYAGVLRGPRGTLLAMAGNSLDRAALLADLLRNSGFRTRFTSGMLSDDLARQLVNSIWQERHRAFQPPSDRATDLAPAAEQLMATIKRDDALVLDHLKGANLPGRASAFVALDRLILETKRHYWVEWWNDGSWKAMDPSFAAATAGQTFAIADSTWDDLPNTLFHRVEIRVGVEEWTAGRSTIRHVLQYAATASDLSGADVILAHDTGAPGTQDTGDVRPFLVVGSRSIHGNPYALHVPKAGAVGDILDAFGGGPEDTPLVGAEFVELEFVAPDGRRETVTREIFDRVGPGRRASAADVNPPSLASEPTAELTAGIYDFFFTTGAVDAWHLAGLTRTAENDEESLDVGAGLRRLSTIFSTLSDLLMNRVTTPDGLVLRSYLDEPRVQVASWSSRDGRLQIGLDLRRDGARLVTSSSKPEHAFLGQVLRGVVNGNLERIVVEHFARASDSRDLPARAALNTSALLERARTEQVPLVLLGPGAAALGSDVPVDARTRVAQALAAGMQVLVPRSSVNVDGAPRLAWWQIDPRSGMTVAVTDEGLHQAQVEAVIIRMDGRNGLTYNVAFRVNGRFISTGGRLFRFGSQAQAENFVTQLGSRLTNIGIDFAWFAI